MDNAHKEHSKVTIDGILASVNKTLHQATSQGTSLKDVHDRRHPKQYPGWTHEQIQTLIYICLAFLCIISIAIISFLYMRSIREKRRSAQAIKSLLDMMAENRSIQSVYTMENNRGSDQRASSVASGHNTTTVSEPNQSGFGPSVEDFPAQLRPGFEPVVGCLEDRIHLPPMGDQPRMPSPHLSAPPLPPIKRPRPRPATSMSSFKPTETPSASELEAISKSLREAEMLCQSAASFPVEKIHQIHLELPRDSHDHDSENIHKDESGKEIEKEPDDVGNAFPTNQCMT